MSKSNWLAFLAGNRTRSGASRRARRKKTVSTAETQLLEDRQLLTIFTDTIVADNVSQFAPNAPGKIEFNKFLGTTINTGIAKVGGFETLTGFGLEARFGLNNGRVGFDVGAFVNPGSVTATTDLELDQSVEEPNIGFVTVTNTVTNKAGSFETTSPSLGGYVDLVANVDVTAELEYSVPFLHDTIGGTFTTDVGQELIAINRDDDRQLRILGDRPIEGREISKEVSKKPKVEVSLSPEKIDDRDDAWLGTIWSQVETAPAKRVGEVSVATPKIGLSSDGEDFDSLTASDKDELATVKVDVAPIIGSALGIGSLLGTTKIDFGIGQAEVTTLKMDLGPELALQQNVTVTPHNLLTYVFDTAVNVTISEIGDDDEVYRQFPSTQSVTFDPDEEQINIDFLGAPIQVTPTWTTSLRIHNDVDLVVELAGSLVAGQLDVSIDFPWGTENYPIGPLARHDFSTEVGSFGVVDTEFELVRQSRVLESFTFGENFMLDDEPPPTVVQTTEDVDYGETGLISLRQAIKHAEFQFGTTGMPQLIRLGEGTYNLENMSDSDQDPDIDIGFPLTIVGTGQTVIDGRFDDDTHDGIRIFDVASDGMLTLEGVGLRNAVTPEFDDPATPEDERDGAAIRNYGTVTVIDSGFLNNQAWGRGGAVYNGPGANFTMEGSPALGDGEGGTVGYNVGINPAGAEGNYAVVGGGMIYNEGTAALDSVQLGGNQTDRTSGSGGHIYNSGTLTLTRSNITGDAGIDAANGGAIYNGPAGKLVVEATSMAENSASNEGGAILNEAEGGFIELTNVTITGNSASVGGGIKTTAFATIHNTIVSGNNAVGVNDIDGRPDSLGYNLVGQATNMSDFPTGNVAGGHNVHSSAPRLSNAREGRLGGVNSVILPFWDSPAVGAGDPDTGKLRDQRGYAPEGLPDIGAAQFIENFTVTNFADDWMTWERSRLGNPTLRDAVNILSEQGGTTPSSITLGLGTFRLEVDRNTPGELYGSLDIGTNLTIIGAGPGLTTIDGSAADNRVFHVHDNGWKTENGPELPGGNLTLRDLTVTGGHMRELSSDDGYGGGILNERALVLDRVVVTNNRSDTRGGGIATRAGSTTTIIDSTIDDNLAWVGGGLVNYGTLTINTSTLSNNNAEGAAGSAGVRNGGGGGGAAGLGGAVAVIGGTVEISDSTISNNQAIGGAGGGVSPGSTILDRQHVFQDGWDVDILTGGTGGSGLEGGTLYIADGTASTSTAIELYWPEDGDDESRFARGAGGGSGVPLATGTNPLGVRTSWDTSGGTSVNGGGGGGAGATGVPTYCDVVTNCNSLWRGGGGTKPGGEGSRYGAGDGGTGTEERGGGGGGGGAAGGGIFIWKGDVSVMSSTITENTVHGGKGGKGLAELELAEVNEGEDGIGTAGGVFTESNGSFTTQNSIIAGNTADDRLLADFQIEGTITTNGHNLRGAGSNWPVIPTDIALGEDEATGLGPLTDNGGFTLTHLPLSHSPALDAGNTAGANDQRGFVRGIGLGDDIGAVESHELVVTSYTDAAGELTLRKALADADRISGHNTIILLGGEYTLDSSVVIGSDVTIRGLGANLTTINGSTASGDLLFVDGFNLTLEGVTVQGPEAGRVLNLTSGRADITGSELIGGTSGSAADGGLVLAGSDSVLNITRSTLTSGQATGSGGALALRGTSVTTVTTSTIHGGSVESGADAIDMTGTASLDLRQSTIASGVENYDGVAVTVGNNNVLTLHNSIIEGRLVGSVNSMGFNVVGDDSSASGLTGEDITNVDPMLGELGDNGGRTRSVRPLAGSPAVDAADDGAGTSSLNGDQRGFEGVLGDGMDIGAVEREELFVTRTDDDTEAGSLRRAIIDANQLPWAATIEIEAGTYVLDVSGSDEDAGFTGDLDVLGNVSIAGQGVQETIIDATGLGDRAFDVLADATLGLSKLTLTGGEAIEGGNIRTAGSLGLATMQLSGGEADAGGAIAVLPTGDADIAWSLLLGNSATNTGGAIDNQGSLRTRHTTFSGNSADVGGAIFNHANGESEVTNATIAENTASTRGGGVSNQSDGNFELTNTLIFDNTASTNDNVDGDFVATNSVIGNIGTASGFADSDVSSGNTYGEGNTVVDPNVGPLTDNGGETMTYRPTENSLLIDSGIDQNEEGLDPETLELVKSEVIRDQRGYARNQRRLEAAEHATDIGATEAQFDLVHYVAIESTVTIQESEPGWTEVVDGDDVVRIINPYRSLTVIAEEQLDDDGNPIDTAEHYNLGPTSPELIINLDDVLDTEDSPAGGDDRLTLLPGSVWNTDTNDGNLFLDGELSGTGTVTPPLALRMESGSTIAPVDGPITVDAPIESSGTWRFELDGDTPGDDYGYVAGTETVSLEYGGTKSVLDVSVAPTATGSEYLLIDNQGSEAVGGTFANLPEGSELDLNGQMFVISYEGGDGNDVVLTDASVLVVDGELRVLGTEGKDTIKITKSGGQLIVSGKLDESAFRREVDASEVDRVSIETRGANDNVDTRSIDLPTTVTGGDGNDTIRTGGGDDVVLGGDGSDYLSAAKGDDTIHAGDGNDRLFGSDGHDELTATGGENTISGGTGDDTVTTGAGADSIVTNGGDDSVSSGAGNDTVKTGGGDDTIVAGMGDDFVSSGSQADSVDGGAGDDEVRSGNGKDTVIAGTGNDSVVAGRGDDTVFGNAGNDSLIGNNGDDLLVGGAGDDLLGGNKDRDALFAGAGSDTLNAGSQDDLLVAASTTHDTDALALDAIMQEWISARSYANRIANLRDGSGSANRKNADYFLVANATVNDDGTQDSLKGGTSSDWFFAKTSETLFDEIADLATDELVDLLT